MREMKKYFNLEDTIKVLIFAGIFAVICGVIGFFPALFGGSGYNVVFYGISVVLLFAIFSHITRRVLFPSISTSELAALASASPIGAAIVFAAILFFLSVLVISGTLLIK